MQKFTLKSSFKFLTLALGLIGNTNMVRATDCDIYQSALADVITLGNTGDCCSINGVKCENIGGVNSITEITLEELDCPNDRETFIDDISKALANLQNLKKFEIKNSHFCKFPENICLLKNLKSLTVNLSFSKRDIPECVSEITNLEELDLTGCGLTGKIPDSIGNLKNLKVLKLSGNNLEGYIPYSFKNLVNLNEFNVFGSRLTGYIPELPNLTVCDYSINNLCKIESTKCGADKLDYCKREDVETSNKNNGNPDPDSFDYDKEVKKHHRTKVTYIACGVCLLVVIYGIVMEIVMRRNHEMDELLDVTTETRDKFNRVVSSNTRTMSFKSYLMEQRVAVCVVGIVGIVLFFVLE